MQRTIAQAVVQINLICAPFKKFAVEQSVALASRTLGAPARGAGNAAHRGTNRCPASCIAADCSEGGSRSSSSCSTADRAPAWTDSRTGRRIGGCRRIVTWGWRALCPGRSNAESNAHWRSQKAEQQTAAANLAHGRILSLWRSVATLLVFCHF